MIYLRALRPQSGACLCCNRDIQESEHPYISIYISQGLVGHQDFVCEPCAQAIHCDPILASNFNAKVKLHYEPAVGQS